jgi:hypothetical protein
MSVFLSMISKQMLTLPKVLNAAPQQTNYLGFGFEGIQFFNQKNTLPELIHQMENLGLKNPFL